MMGIPLRHHRRLVPEQSLHLVQIDPRLHQLGREGVPEVVEMTILEGALGSIAA